MSALGTFSAQGFQVTASNAIELIAGTQAAGAGMVSANVREVGELLHVDFANLSRTLADQGSQLASVNARGFDAVRRTLEGGFGTLETLSGLSIATQAVGFAVVATQLAGVRRDVRELTGKAAELVELQRNANGHLESLADFAQRQLKTQEQILATLVSSRTVEAQQLVRQGWENLRNGYEDDAFERFQRSLDYDNTVYVTHAELGAINEKRGQVEKAEDHFRRAGRFAAQAGPAIAAFAAVQLASFLDRRGRPAEALTTLREGLRAWRTPAWVFYLAELSAEAGDADAAHASLRDAVGGDPTLFAAAMASERLQRLQPRLAGVLIELDRELRAPVFDAVRRAAVAASQVEDLGGEHRDLHQRAKVLFERLAVTPFGDLLALRAEAEALATDAEAAVDQAARDAAGPVSAAHDALVDHVGRPPSSIAPGAPTSTLTRLGAVGVIVLGLFGSCVSFAVGNITGAPPPTEPGSELGGASPVAPLSHDAGSMNGLLCAAITLLVALVPALVLYLRADRLQKREGDQRTRGSSEQWWAYADRAEALRGELQRRRDNLRERLSAALRRGANRTLDEGLRWVEGLAVPAATNTPAWVTARDSTGAG